MSPEYSRLILRLGNSYAHWSKREKVRISIGALEHLLRDFAHAAEFFSVRTFISSQLSLLSRMAFDTLEHGNIAQVNRVFEWFIGSVAGVAFAIGEAAEIDRVLNR